MSVPSSNIASVIPGVIGGGGSNALLSGLFVTQNTLMPTNSVLSFANAAAVSAFFGPSSAEAAQAVIYFNGFTNSTQLPSAMLFAPFNLDARSAYLQGGNLSSLTLTQLAALSGSLTIVVDGYSRTAASINLSSYASSYSVAAAQIETEINASLPSEATGSACTIAGTVLTVAGTLTGTFATGQTITGSSVTAGSVITAQLTGTVGGAGTYSLSESSTIVSGEAITASATAVVVTWNSTLSCFVITSGITGAASLAAFATGTIAAGLGLTSLTGATLSQGASADTPATAMNNAIAISQNFASITLMWEPDLADKTNFSVWSSSQPYNPYLVIIWDTDPQTIYQGSTECFGYLAKQAAYNGVVCISGDPNVAAQASAASIAAGGPAITLASMLMNIATFLSGAIASVDFSRTNGRTDFTYKSQAGLLPACGNLQILENLIANGYNTYATWASKGNSWTGFTNSNIPGKWLWIDPFIDQIWMSDQIQVALVNLVMSVGSIPYTPSGYGLIDAALAGPTNDALNFGAIRAGVVLSPVEIAEVNAAVGLQIASILQTLGWYRQILDPGSSARTARSTPIINYWYTDGSSVQSFTVASFDVQ